MTDTGRARLLARLSHDVGKYVARTARNVPTGPVPDALVQMLARDLYELEDGRPASALLAARLADGPDVSDEGVARAARLLDEADGLEARVRAGEPAAVARAAAIAVEVSELLRAAALAARGRGA